MGHKCSRYASLSPNTMCSEILYQTKKEAKSFFYSTCHHKNSLSNGFLRYLACEIRSFFVEAEEHECS